MKKLIILPLIAATLAACSPVNKQLEEAAQLFNSGRASDAVVIYRAAAVQGNPEAQLQLAKCYDFGRGVEQNLEEAVIW